MYTQPAKPILILMLPSLYAFCKKSHLTHLSFSTLQQLGGDPQSWTEVYGVLKGTSLFCFHRQEDVEANIEPAFTIAINKVSITRNHWKMEENSLSPEADTTFKSPHGCVVSGNA